jgi:hypothetical protein
MLVLMLSNSGAELAKTVVGDTVRLINKDLVIAEELKVMHVVANTQQVTNYYSPSFNKEITGNKHPVKVVASFEPAISLPPHDQIISLLTRNSDPTV